MKPNENSHVATEVPTEVTAGVATETKATSASHERNRVIARWATLLGYFGLLALLLNWFSWIAPTTNVPRALPLIVLTVPLLFPLRGLLHGKTYTHAWVSLLALPYFAIGVDVAFNRLDQRWLGLAMIFFSLLLFIGAVFFSYSMKKIRKAQQAALEVEDSDTTQNQPVAAAPPAPAE